MDIPDTFKDIAPFLQHPLVLVGFVILLFFGILTALLKAQILPPLPQKTAGDIIKRVINFGFVIALLIIFLGFWEHSREHDGKDSSDHGPIPHDSTISHTPDSTIVAHHSTDGGDQSGKKVYCKVTLLIPSEYHNAEIRVDGRPAVVLDQTLTSLTLRMEKKEMNQTIVLLNTNGEKCTTSVLVDADKQLTPCL